MGLNLVRQAQQQLVPIAATVTTSTVTVTTTSGVMLAANPNRIHWVAEHKTGAGEAYIVLGPTATAANGMTLAPNMERYQEGGLFLGAISVIGSAACTLLVTEYSK